MNHSPRDKQKVIVYYLPSKEPRNTPYISERTRLRHQDMCRHYPAHIRCYLATHQSQYLGQEIFQPDYELVDGLPVPYSGVALRADLILGMTSSLESKRIYHNPIREICKDKTHIERLFPDLCLRSILCQNYQNILAHWGQIESELKVLKPASGSGGRGVHISHTPPSQAKLGDEYPYLLQHFRDTSAGCMGYPGMHDLRVVLLDGEIIGVLLRRAPQGSYLANVSLGAEIIDLKDKPLPEDVLSIIQRIEAYVAPLYPERYYSIDMGVGRDGSIKVFELNSSPALSTASIRAGLARKIVTMLTEQK